MAGTRKRYAVDDINPKRKSARSARAPERLGAGPAPTKLDAVEGLEHVQISLQGIDLAISRYNKTLPFVPGYNLRKGDVQTRHRQILQARNEILKTWNDAVDKIVKLEYDIANAAEYQQWSSFGHSNWYLHGDVMSKIVMLRLHVLSS